jgi:hypothetical protein
MPDPIQYTARDLDLGPRLFRTLTVAASPAAAAETIVATLTITEDLAVSQGVYLFAQIGFTVGTNGVSARLRIKHTNASGATLGDTGAKTETAANLDALSCLGFDASPSSPTTGQVYVATLILASASAASTVGSAALFALVV